MEIPYSRNHLSPRQTAHQKQHLTAVLSTVSIHFPPTQEKFKALNIVSDSSPSPPKQAVCSTAERYKAKHVTAYGCVVKLQMCREIVVLPSYPGEFPRRGCAQPCAFPLARPTRGRAALVAVPGTVGALGRAAARAGGAGKPEQTGTCHRRIRIPPSSHRHFTLLALP